MLVPHVIVGPTDHTAVVSSHRIPSPNLTGDDAPSTDKNAGAQRYNDGSLISLVPILSAILPASSYRPFFDWRFPSTLYESVSTRFKRLPGERWSDRMNKSRMATYRSRRICIVRHVSAPCSQLKTVLTITSGTPQYSTAPCRTRRGIRMEGHRRHAPKCDLRDAQAHLHATRGTERHAPVPASHMHRHGSHRERSSLLTRLFIVFVM